MSENFQLQSGYTTDRPFIFLSEVVCYFFKNHTEHWLTFASIYVCGYVSVSWQPQIETFLYFEKKRPEY